MKLTPVQHTFPAATLEVNAQELMVLYALLAQSKFNEMRVWLTDLYPSLTRAAGLDAEDASKILLHMYRVVGSHVDPE